MGSCSSDRSAHPAEFVADVVSIDRAALEVTWAVNCGPREGERLKTSVASATFEYETNPGDPTRGHVNPVRFIEWAESVSDSGPWIVKSEDNKVISVASFSAPNDHDPCSS
jgi:hypothetical protein